MLVFIDVLRVFSIFCTAIILGKIVQRLRLPAILGWLIAGIVFGPHLAGIVSLDIMDSLWYKIVIKVFECFAGVMIGREIIFKKIKASGPKIMGITIVQSLGTFLFVTLAFIVTFLIADVPLYLAAIFGAIALATAPAPALSIVNEYKTNGPVTRTLVPLAAIDDVIGIIVFFTVISLVGSLLGNGSTNPWITVLIIVLPFVVGILIGVIFGFLIRLSKNKFLSLGLMIGGLLLTITTGILIDYYAFGSFQLNYMLMGMAYSASIANLVKEEDFEPMMDSYSPLLNVSLVLVIVNLGMPLDYALIGGAGVFTAIYIISRAIGKYGGAFLGGKLTKAEPTVAKWLGLTLLPHSGVSLVFAGIAMETLNEIDPSLSTIVSGTIVAAAIINEIIAVVLAKVAFRKAGEIASGKKEETSLAN